MTTLSDAKRLLAEWQKRLRLEDWSITISLESDLVLDGNNGIVRYSMDNRTAHIQMSSNPDKPFDEALVHELTHLPLSPFEPDSRESLEHTMFEQAINLLAAALTI